MAELTRRQREALDWLSRVGKATARTMRQHGFAPRTFEALYAAGLVRVEYRRDRSGIPAFPVYYPKEG